MDPNACLKELQEAYAAGDDERAHDLCLDLIGWLDNGGFMPTVTRADLTYLVSCVRLLTR